MIGGDYTYPAILLSLLALLLIVWQAYSRSDRRFLLGRILLSFLAVMSLLLAILRPARTVIIPSDAAILLTPFSDPEVLSSLLKKDTSLRIFRLEGSEKIKNAKVIPGLFYLKNTFPELKKLFLLGDGVPQYQFPELDSFKVEFYLNAPPSGIQRLEYTSILKEGENFKLSVTFLQKGRTADTLILKTPAKEIELFHNQTTIATPPAGKYLFDLALKNGELLGQLPVVVHPTDPLHILILNAAPTFETRYLKDWLADEGFSVAVRSTISKDRYIKEFLNRNEINLDRMESSFLRDIDLIISSGAGLMTLSPAERRQLKSAIQEGLGLLLIADETDLPASVRRAFFNFPLRASESVVNQLFLNQNIELTKVPYTFNDGANIYPLHPMRQSAYRQEQNGRVLMTLLQNTYRLLLEGEQSAYQKHWAELITVVSRREERSPIVLKDILHSEPDHPFQVNIFPYTKTPKLEVQREKGKAIEYPCRQDPVLDDTWTTTFWPDSSGWYQLSLGATKKAWAFIHPSNSWQSLKRTRRIQQNKALADQMSDSLQELKASSTLREEYPVWWYYLAFLLCVGLLWFEEKYR